MSACLHVLGTAQDGGIPHVGCCCATCEAARADPTLARRVASIALVGVTGRTLLVDATPDFPRQIHALAERLGRRDPTPDAVLLTHAHLGHYLGLSYLGREAMSAASVPVYVTERMARFLRGNRPWSHLVTRGEIVLQGLAPGEPFAFDGLEVLPFSSPHRAEDTDTVGVDVRGPAQRILYLPDADRFPPDLEARIKDVDVALVDGTFYDRSELPHRDVDAIPHPRVAESVVQLQGARGRVYFTHLNHSNRLLHPDASARPQLPEGFAVLAEDATWTL